MLYCRNCLFQKMIFLHDIKVFLIRKDTMLRGMVEKSLLYDYTLLLVQTNRGPERVFSAAALEMIGPPVKANARKDHGGRRQRNRDSNADSSDEPGECARVRLRFSSTVRHDC